MSKQGWSGLGDLLKDLYRELTPVVRTCLFAGMAMGFLMGLYFALGVPPDEASNILVARVELRIVFLILCGLTLLGGVVGTAVGVTVEVVFSVKDKQDKKKPWWRGKKSSRRRD